MIYFDTACIAKCYLNEPGAAPVRALGRRSPGLASCGLGRVEFQSVLHRHVREGRIRDAEMEAVLADFDWFPDLPLLARQVAIRSGDALHLVCAQAQRHGEIFTNDRHMLTAAPYFQLQGVNPGA